MSIKRLLGVGFILAINLFLMVSCPQELVKGSVWTGVARSDNMGDINLCAYFRSDNTLVLYIQKMNSFPASNTYYEASGAYTISSVNSLRANLSSQLLYDDDNYPDSLTLDLEGTLYFNTGKSDGDFVMNVDNTSWPDYNFSGTFELDKQNSY